MYNGVLEVTLKAVKHSSLLRQCVRCWNVHSQQSNILSYCANVYNGLLENNLTAVKRSSLLRRCVQWGAGNNIKSSQTF